MASFLLSAARQAITVVSIVVSIDDQTVTVTNSDNKTDTYYIEAPDPVPDRIVCDQEKALWNLYSTCKNTATEAVAKIKERYGKLEKGDLSGKGATRTHRMIAYDEVAEAKFQIMPKTTTSTTESKPRKDFGTLKDQPSKMKNAMATLLNPKYNGNRCAELDDHLIDTIGLRKPAKLLSNLTDGHTERTDGQPYVPDDSHFGDGPGPSIITGYHQSDASMLSIHSVAGASGIGDDRSGQHPQSSMATGKRGNAGDHGGSVNKFAKTGRTTQTPRSITTPPATKTSLLSGQPSIDVRQLLQFYEPNPPPTIANDHIVQSLPATLRPGLGRTHNQAMTMLRDEATQLGQHIDAETFETDYGYIKFAQKIITSGIDTKFVSLPDFVQFLMASAIPRESGQVHPVVRLTNVLDDMLKTPFGAGQFLSDKN